MRVWNNSDYKLSFEYARKLTKEYSKSFYISSKLLPKEKRWATYSLYGFCRYVDNIVDNPRMRTPFQLERELDAIKEELTVAFKTGESEHPIINSFARTATLYSIPLNLPLELIEGVRMDVNINRYKSFNDLYLFAYRVAGVVGLMMTYILGYSDNSAFYYAEKLGVAMQLTNILRDISEDILNGKIYIPLDELERFGVSEEDILDENFSENFYKLMEFQVERARKYYDAANPGINLLEKDSRFAISSASKIYSGILNKIEKNDLSPFFGRVFVPAKKKLTILFSEYFKARFSSKKAADKKAYAAGEINFDKVLG
jgi:phytoene synthase